MLCFALVMFSSDSLPHQLIRANIVSFSYFSYTSLFLDFA